MRALLQRVSSAEVVVEGARVGVVKQGLLALIGIGHNDTAEDSKWLINKIINCRLFEVEGKPWKGSVKSLGLEVLLVSQFTLHASTKKPQPDFHRALGSEAAKTMFDAFVESFKAAHGAHLVQTGTFGAMMSVSLCNEGPVTVWIDSKNRNDVPWDAAETGTPTVEVRTSGPSSGTPAATPTAATSAATTNAAVDDAAAASGAGAVASSTNPL